jgi:hypothetical protein
MTPLKALQTRAIVALFGRVSSPCLSSRSQQSRRGWFSPPIRPATVPILPSSNHEHGRRHVETIACAAHDINRPAVPTLATGGAMLFRNVRIFNGVLIVNRVPLQM